MHAVRLSEWTLWSWHPTNSHHPSWHGTAHSLPLKQACLPPTHRCPHRCCLLHDTWLPAYPARTQQPQEQQSGPASAGYLTQARAMPTTFQKLRVSLWTGPWFPLRLLLWWVRGHQLGGRSPCTNCPGSVNASRLNTLFLYQWTQVLAGAMISQIYSCNISEPWLPCQLLLLLVWGLGPFNSTSHATCASHGFCFFFWLFRWFQLGINAFDGLDAFIYHEQASLVKSQAPSRCQEAWSWVGVLLQKQRPLAYFWMLMAVLPLIQMPSSNNHPILHAAARNMLQKRLPATRLTSLCSRAHAQGLASKPGSPLLLCKHLHAHAQGWKRSQA